MRKSLFSSYTIGLLLVFGMVLFLTPLPHASAHSIGQSYVSTAADATADICAGINQVNAATCGGTGGTKLSSLVATIINVLSVIAGVAAVIMIIIGGLRYITSGGDSNSVSAAKKTIIYAIVGLVVVAFAEAIVRFTVGKLK